MRDTYDEAFPFASLATAPVVLKYKQYLRTVSLADTLDFRPWRDCEAINIRFPITIYYLATINVFIIKAVSVKWSHLLSCHKVLQVAPTLNCSKSFIWRYVDLT